MKSHICLVNLALFATLNPCLASPKGKTLSHWGRARQNRDSQIRRKMSEENQHVNRRILKQPKTTPSLITQLDQKFNESAPEIIRLTNNARRLLEQSGISESNESIMRGINSAFNKPMYTSQGTNRQSYAEYVALYVMLRKG